MIKIKPIKIHKFPTVNELKTFTIDDLYSLAKHRFGLHEVLVNFLTKEKSNQLNIQNVDMSDRLRYILLRAEIETLDKLAFIRKNDVKTLKGIGVKTLSEIEQIMMNYKLEFRN